MTLRNNSEIKQIKTQIRFMKMIVMSKKKELEKAREYEKYHLPGYRKQVSRIKLGLIQAIKDLEILEKRLEEIK